MVIITLLPLGSNDLISSAKLFSKSAGFPGRTEGDGGRLFSFACGKGFGKNLPASRGNVRHVQRLGHHFHIFVQHGKKFVRHGKKEPSFGKKRPSSREKCPSFLPLSNIRLRFVQNQGTDGKRWFAGGGGRSDTGNSPFACPPMSMGCQKIFEKHLPDAPCMNGKGKRLQWRMAGRGCRRSPSANGPGAGAESGNFRYLFFYDKVII
ncbi:hypothetical protein Cdeb_00798 [Caldibacillus debilis GB1]|uniref:Uncharacterized protein n=1 Tax=Caldibacillus debilis GB1 TaxID=1339248 RepID=A0A420VEU0_9BACI|nr:hypothetical protein Cdeb_00798 [Caldibacillus debilis GB1]